jgi:hypothetical protein
MNDVNKAIYEKLSAGTALTALLPGTTSIYHLQAPNNATLPYVVYSLQAGGDENSTPARMRNLLVYVRAYSGNSAKSAGSIDTQIDALLHCGSISVSGYDNFWLHREVDVENIDNQPSGEKAWMQGAFYRCRIQKS